MAKVLTVAALTVGAFVAGLLLAPKSGKETRQDIKDKVDEYRSKADAGMAEVKKGASHVKDEIVEGAENLKGAADDAAKNAQHIAGRVKKEVSTRGRNLQQEVEKTVADTRRATNL